VKSPAARSSLFERFAVRSVAASVVVFVLVAAGLTLVGDTVGSTGAAQAVAGVPAAPTLTYFENFENSSGSTTVPLTSYVGGSAALGATYTADPAYLPSANACDGSLISANRMNASTDTCLQNYGGYFYGVLQSLSTAMGEFEGQSGGVAAGNTVLAEDTGGSSVPSYVGNLFKTTSNLIPAVTGHFYDINADLGAVAYRPNTGSGCATYSGYFDDPLLTFSLLDGTTPINLTSGLDPCTAPGSQTFTVNGVSAVVAQLSSTALQWPGGSSMGLQLSDSQSDGGDGNDAALDNVQVVDVTPQLDQSFSPTSIIAGGTSTLVYTVTNTSDLNAKSGWGFHNDLPSGVTATGVNSTTCSAGSVSAWSGSTSVTLTNGTLTQGQTSCTVSVQVTSSVTGSHLNDASNFPAGPAGLNGLLAPASSTLQVASSVASLSLVTSVSPSNAAAFTVGSVATYSFVVTNTGNVTLTNVHPTQTQFTGSGTPSAISCPSAAASLAPGAQVTCTATYTVTQADVNNNGIAYSATATGTPSAGNAAVSAVSTANDPGTQSPALSVTKSASVVSVAAAGDPILYSFVLKNTGNVTLTNVTPTEGVFTGSGTLSAISCPAGAASMVPGVSVTCIAFYRATQADVDSGSVSNSATATGTPPLSFTGPVPVAESSTAVVAALQDPGLAITTTSDVGSVTQSGTVVTYSFLLSNTGNVTLTNVHPVEGVFTGHGGTPTPVCPAGAASLAPGASVTCTATYTVVAADIGNSKSFENTATATGTPPNSDPAPLAAPSSLVVTAAPPLALTSLLAFTGMDAGPALWTGVGLLLAGVTLWVLMARRRRRTGPRHRIVG